MLDYFEALADPQNLGRSSCLQVNGKGAVSPELQNEPDKKMKKKKATSSKAANHSQTVHAPERALRALESQDLLFGTSSQLVREESPTLLREVQQAMKESEASIEVHQASLVNTSSPSIVPTSFQPPRRLWEAAARDADGSLLELKIIDLSQSPESQNTTSNSTLIEPLKASCVNTLPVDEGRWLDIESLNTPLPAKSTSEMLCIESEVGVIEPVQIMPRSVAEGALRERPGIKSPIKKRAKTLAGDGMPSMPDFAAYAQTKLERTVASYGFKPMKNRKRMIELVQRCWESKVKLKLQSLPQNAHVPALDPKSSEPQTKKASPETVGKELSSKAKPKTTYSSNGMEEGETCQKVPKTRGRPRKIQPVLTVAAGTEGEPTEMQYFTAPNADVTGPRQVLEIPQGLKLGTLQDQASPSNAPTTRTIPPPEEAIRDIQNTLPSNEQVLSDKITEAITTFPSSSNSLTLTWHEKILIYDPIVLEDLTTWLNTVGLERVGVDEEVWPALVRDWCEARSVCCLWKANLRGGERKRY